MIRIGIIAGLLTLLVTTAWLLKNEVAINGHLSETNTALQAKLDQASRVNRALAQRLEEVIRENRDLQRKILIAEQRKTEIQREAETLRDQINVGIQDSPGWAAQPVPDRVAGPARAAIDRLYPATTNGRDH